MSLRVKRGLTVLAGLVVAAVMLLLGLWQMSSYQRSMSDVAAERAALPALELADSVSPSGQVGDIYGRRVAFSGHYLNQQFLVGTSWPMRLVTAFRLTDGRILPVVRGSLAATQELPTPPAGQTQLQGIFTSGDITSSQPAPTNAPADSMPSLRLQQLVQTWPGPMIPGYVTLGEPSPGLAKAEAILPKSEGSAMNRGYAMQWWVFAAAAIAFSIVVARGYKDPAPEVQQTAAS